MTEDFFTRITQPVQVCIIRQDIFPVAQAENADERRAGLEGRAEPGFAFAQARLAGPQLRFRLFPFSDVMGHAENMRHMVEMDEFAGNQHDEDSSRAVPKPPLLLAHGARLAKAGPEVAAILLIPPQTKFERISSQDFGARVARPIHKGIIHQHVPTIAYLRDRDNDWAGLKSGTEARFALGQRGLGALAFGDVRDERLDDLSPAPSDPRQTDLQRDFPAARIAGQPIKPGAARGHAFSDMFTSHGRRALSVRLAGR